MKTFRYLDLITTAFAVVLILSNITSTKILSLGWLKKKEGVDHYDKNTNFNPIKL